MMRMMINDSMCNKGTDSLFVEGHMPIGTFSWLFQQHNQWNMHFNVSQEDHCMQLRGNGLLSSIEPAGGGGC
ncbi:hypothetical protein Patl1_23609 [Pistacia atlantica]|uniref:Uncharacterized protein n=1 Tax=Pistacia atlantica TaxID=434234 RepID=A0ACC0ZWU9_9ROSI|nr:hypothetical protein Patl1_23609 [Pistacia atlantica]